MPKVKFTETVVYETEGRNQGPKFEEGKIYELSDEHAQRWVRRNVAKVVEDKNNKKAETEEPEVAEESDEEEEEQEEEAEGDSQPTMPRRRGRPPKAR